MWQLWSQAVLWLVCVPRVWPSPVQSPLVPQDHSQGYEFDPLLHLPGTSPYFDAVGFGLRHEAPEGCTVAAASYLVRHAAIYSNEAEYDEYIKPFLFRLEKYRGEWEGPLSFLNEWTSPILEDKLEDITPSGRGDAQRVGAHLVKRYSHIVNTTKLVLADKKPRCYDTALEFIKDFPNPDSINVTKIQKPQDGSIHPIIPHKTCKAFSKSPGSKEQSKFISVYASRVVERLRSYIPYDMSEKDVVAMQSICGYESAITGKGSPLCAVFTDAEWMAYEYAWDLKYAHMVGPYNRLSPYLGFPWLRDQTKIFALINETGAYPGDQWPDGQRFFLYFTHREVPPFIATALGLFNSSFEALSNTFPTDHIVWTRAWRMSDLIPFLGHVGLEKLSCDRPGMEGDYVRIIANTAPRPIPRCQSGPGASCPFDRFQAIIGEGVKTYGNYKKACKND